MVEGRSGLDFLMPGGGMFPLEPEPDLPLTPFLEMPGGISSPSGAFCEVEMGLEELGAIGREYQCICGTALSSTHC